MDLTGNVRIATADEDKSLGTGANDYGAATTLFGGVGCTVLGDSDFIEVDSVINANLGFSHKLGANSIGLMYDYRQPTSDSAGDRSEVTGFYIVPTAETGKLQLHASKGLADGSPDWGAGVNFIAGF